MHWGDEQREKIDEYLNNVAFFIPVITPRSSCGPSADESSNSLPAALRGWVCSGWQLPILYIPVPELEEDLSDDELMRTVKRFQWKPWGDLRFADRDTQPYRSAVASLSQEPVLRVAEIRTVDIVAAAQQLENELLGSENDDAPDLLDHSLRQRRRCRGGCRPQPP